MKRLLKLMVVAILVLSPIMVGRPIAAQQATCEIGFSGPDASGNCTSRTTYQCSVTNTNTVTIRNESNQVVASGEVEVSGNTSGGSGTSGSVTNTSGTTFSVTITNASSDQEPGICVATVVVPAVTPPTETTVTPPSEQRVEALPVTSSDSLLPAAAWGAVGAALLAIVSVIGAILYYRRRSL